GRKPKVLEVRESFRTLGELCVFSATGRGLLDIGHRDAQIFCLARSTVALGHEDVELGLLRLPAIVDLAVVAQQRGERRTGETVERLALRRPGTEPALLGLAVHDDELLADLPQYPGGSGASADDGTTPAVLGDRSPENQLGS